ncbi:hypothetical protein DW178_10770 [Eggerthella sp. AM16-19]|uniref:hypothetical protein n=1 Tax=Eggerthella sp. AM16-19 TaxID=2292042 RepID=UPI000E54E942|nr:hypothetical protein [Eggerthella sp. AM16-19]RHO35641.1 hypothetical protein DW178_10770 [Eggerthella sp. AM16-19]
MSDAPPAPSGQRSVTLDIGMIGSGLGDGIDIEEAYRLVATAMENDAELMAAVGAARERAVETVRGNLAAKSARGGLEEYRRVLDVAFEDAIDELTASMGMTASPDQKNTFNSAFDAFAAANASIYKSSADFRRECVDLLAKRALAELGSPVPADFDAQSRISGYIGELSREQAAKTISSLHGLKVSEVLAAGRKRIAQALGDLMRRLRGKSAAAKAPAAPRQAPAAASPEVEDAPAEKGVPSAPKHAAAKAPAADDSDERLRDLINGIGTSLRSGLPTGTRGRHAAPVRSAANDIDEPPCADNIVEFKPLDAERERERSAAIDLRVPAVPPVRAAAAAACASAAAPVRNYSLNLR